MTWFILIAMLLCALMYGYIAWRLPERWGKARPYLNIYIFVVWFTSLSPILFRYLNINDVFVDVVSWFVYLNMGFASLLFVAYLAWEVLYFAKAFYHKHIRSIFMARPSRHTNQDRREFMSHTMHLGVLGATGAVTGIGIHQAVGGAVIKEVRVPLSNVPKPLQDLKIVQFTDLHIGSMIKRDYVQTIVTQINALTPDIVVMTGDLVDGSVAHLQDDVAPLAELHPKVGKYFITGNHEYYSGAEAWVAEMQRLGFTVLLNEHQLIEHQGAKLLMAGVTDYRAHQYLPAHQSSPLKAMQGAPEADVKILLAHQPKSIFEAADAGFDLQISGHTHGGQYYPWNFIAQMANPYIKGLHLHDNKTWIYVSPGTGYWGPPVRLGNEPELTVIRLG